MNKKELYNIIQDVDDCFYTVAAIGRITKLFHVAFKQLNNTDGEGATITIIEQLEKAEIQLDNLHSKVDNYILNNL